MIELLQFVFSSFWTFAGTAFLLCIVGNTLVAVAATIAAIAAGKGAG